MHPERPHIHQCHEDDFPVVPFLKRMLAGFLVLHAWFSHAPTAPAFTSLEPDVSWRRIDARDGLAEGEILFLTPGFKDRVWMTHLGGELASATDGYQLDLIPYPPGPPFRIHESRTGQVWTTNSRDILLFRNGRWNALSLPDPTLFDDGQIVGILPAEYNHVLVIFENQLLEFDILNNEMESLIAEDESRIGKFLDIRLARDQGAWILGEKGIARIPPPIRNLTRGLNIVMMPLPDAMDCLLSDRFFEIEPGFVLLSASFGDQIPAQETLLAWTGSQWKVAIEDFRGWEQLIPHRNRQAVLNGRKVEFDEDLLFPDGSPDKPIRDLAALPDGSLVVARGEGLYKETENLWKKRIPQPAFHILDIDESSHEFLILTDRGVESTSGSGSTSTLLSPWPGGPQQFPEPSGESSKATRAVRIRKLSDHQYWIQHHSSAWIYETLNHSWNLQTLPATTTSQSTRVPDLPVLNDSGEFTWLWTEQSERTTRIRGKSAESTPVDLGILTNYWADSPIITDIAFRSPDLLWIATGSGLAWFDSVNWSFFDFQMADMPFPILDVHLSMRGPPLFACRDGIFEFNGQSFERSLESRDPVTQILQTRNGGLWALSQSEVFRLYESTWISYGMPENLSADRFYSLHEDKRRQIWLCSDEGLFVYSPAADYDSPETAILVTPPEVIPDNSGVVTTTLSGTDKWNHTYSSRLLFSYQIDGRDWTPFLDTRKLLINNLAQGNHTLNVRAMDRNGNIDMSPASWEFKLVIPWHYDTRVVIMVVITSCSLLFLAWLALDRHLSLQKSYRRVEQIVQERTRQLEEANEQLLMHQKMRAMGALASGIAHDFNSILSIVQGSAQIIKANLDKPDKIQTRVDRIETVVRQGSSLVKAMLGFARDRNLILAPIRIPELIDSTLEILNDRRPREISIHVEAGDDLPQGSGNREFLQQILVNLLLNAFDALDNKGEIRIIATASPVMDDKLHIRALKARQAPAYIYVYIQDFGCGMSHEIMERIFEPFFTTKALSTKKGTGLGLSMVYELAQQMEYGLGVGSVENHFSIFAIQIPAA